MVENFKAFFEMRSTAQRRAKELITFLTEKCEPNDAIPEEIKPKALKEEITKIFYESERLKNGYRSGNLPNSKDRH